jgi:predicted ribosomally synthesized peptide with SipW-like signal peptide
MTRTVGALALVVALGAMVAAGTGAFFSDSETSSNNVLTAGAIDLKVDHERQTYNGYDCETCSVNIWSSTATVVTAGTGAYDGGYPTNALALSFIHPNWVSSIPSSPAEWIWVTDPVLQADTTNGAEYTFENTFHWNGSVAGIDLEFALAADNGYKIVFNGVEIDNKIGTEFNYGSLLDTTSIVSAMLPVVQNGLNTLEITVRNKPGSSNPANNPAGLLFDLEIVRPGEECENDSTFQKMCRLWSAKDLVDGDRFYYFDDIKPGDDGSNLISLHMSSNDAYACMITHNVDSTDETCVDPEEGPDGTYYDGCNPLGEGELDDGIEAAAWIDTDKDGDYDSDEEIVWEGYLADIVAKLELFGNDTLYLGTAWCAGDLIISEVTDGYTCNGEAFAPGNAAQTDKLNMDVTVWGEQQRNNDLDCSEIATLLRDGDGYNYQSPLPR